MNDSSKENGFFRWVRELGLSRGEDNWIGGVATGLSQRLGISTVLVRGIFVALCFAAGLGVFLYGIAWALMPGQDGKIHLQEAIAGRWSSGMTGAVVFAVIGAAGTPAIFGGGNDGFFGWWDGGLWTLLIVAGVCYLIFARRGRFTQDPRANAPTDPDPADPSADAPYAGFAAPDNTSDSGFGPEPEMPDATVPLNSTGIRDEGRVSSTLVPPLKDHYNAGAIESGPSPTGPDAPTRPVGDVKKTNGTSHQEKTMDIKTPSTSGPSAAEGPAKPQGPADGTRAAGSAATSGFGPPAPPSRSVPAAGPGPLPQEPRPPRSKAIPGYAATIVLGLAVITFALITGLSHLGMLWLPVNAISVGFAAALVVIALGLIGAAVKKRTGGALVGFGIVALIFSLLWGGGSFRDSGPISGFRGITDSENGSTTNVFHSGEMDLRSYSTITSDTTVKIDSVFSSTKLIVPDNIPVVIDSQSAFGSTKINGSTAEIRNGDTVLNAGTRGPELRLQIDGAFSSIEINVEKVEVAP